MATSDLISRITSLGQPGDDPIKRIQLLEAAWSLIQELEMPRETIIRCCWSQV